jgi:DNA-binding response OmpR family regulator
MKKLFIIIPLCLAVIYCGWLGYNQMNPKVVQTFAKYGAHYENESQMFEKADPSLVVLDLMLPDVSGEEICKI